MSTVVFKDFLLQTLSAFIVLFAVIDIVGSIPIILSIKAQGTKIEPWKATIVALILLVSFMYLGQGLLSMFGVDINSFAVAGAIVLFIIALEMVVGTNIMKQESSQGASIVPIAFPLLAGTGKFTTLLTLRAEYDEWAILFAVLLNMGVVFFVLSCTSLIEKKMGQGVIYVITQFFGVILLAISIKLFTTNIATLLASING